MRRMLALGILVVAVLGTAEPLTCDSGGVAHAEEAPPALKKSDRLPILPDRETAWAQPGWRYATEHLPQPAYQRRRGPPRGDFWTDDEIKRIFESRQLFGY